MDSVGLIAAMPQESAALLRCIKGGERVQLGAYRGWHFQLLDRDCLMLQSGMGLQRATDATRFLLTQVHPQFLVSFGIAGAVNPDLNIGDGIVAAISCLLDKGLPGQFQPLASLSTAAWNAAAQALQGLGAHLFSGTAITTRGSQVIQPQLGALPHPILEMETAGIARVAAENGIPLLSIRSISDGPRSPIPFDLEAVLDEQDNLRLGKLLMMVIRRPWMILQTRRMTQNSRKAADFAAVALVAAFRQPSPILSS